MTDIDEITLVLPRLQDEEGFKNFLYDDATGLRVKAPVGYATIGFGSNIQAGWSRTFALKVLRLQTGDVWETLSHFPWFLKCNAARRSVLLDIGFNDGVEGLIGFHKMIAAILADDWLTAKEECHVKNAVLLKRYLFNAEILLTGKIAGGVLPP
jgi:hypothetical protein